MPVGAHNRVGNVADRRVREPLTDEENDLLANACEEGHRAPRRPTLLDTRLGVSERCDPRLKSLLWQ
jgi:hypothetical protein